MKWLLDEVRSFIAPFYCRYCRSYLERNEPLCYRCTRLIKPVLSTTLHVNKEVSVQVYAVGAYEEPLKSLILAKNYSDYEASAYLGTILYQQSVLDSLTVDYLIPVPLHHRKLSQRGYNQASVIAQEIHAFTHVPVLDCVIRIKNTESQSRCSRLERFSNINGAFQATAQATNVAGKRILLVDDMMTTGATLSELARVLIAYKPVSIQGIVVSGPCE